MRFSRSPVTYFIIVLFSVYFTTSLKAQVIEQNISLADSLKKKYGDKVHVVCLNSTTTVTFKYSGMKNVVSPVIASESIDEKLISLKDNYSFTQELEYDGNSDVSEIKAYGKNNRPADVYTADVAIGQDNVFYTGAHCKEFLMPFESLGQESRYTATRYYGDLKYFNDILFSDYYPFEKRTVIFNVPKWLNIEFKEENCDAYGIIKTVTEDPKTQNTIYTFTAKNIKQYHENEENTPNMWSMLPHILILPKSYITPSGETVDIINSMDDLYKLLEGLVKTAGNKDDAIKSLVAKLTEGKKNDTDKIKAIYYWVQDNIRYVAFENGISGLKPASCQDVCDNKYGDCKGMANLLTIMLKDAGFDARRTWIGVEGIPYDFTTPSLCIFNHAICTLIYNGKKYYLDGVEKYAPFGDNSDWIQGKQVLIEDGDKFIEDKVPVETVDRSKVEMTEDLTVKGSDILVGKEMNIYNGESKASILEGYNMAPTDERSADLKEMAQGSDKNIEVTNVVTSDLTNREIPVTMTFNFTIKDQVSEFDNDMYVNLDDKKWFQSLTFDSTRYCDYSFRFRRNYVHTVNFTIPDGYTVKHMPDNVAVKTAGYIFNVTITQSGNKIVYKKDLEILDPIIKKKNFKTWNTDLSQLKKTYDDQLVLEKK